MIGEEQFSAKTGRMNSGILAVSDQWLGEGGEDRLKLEEKDGVIPKGSEAVYK